MSNSFTKKRLELTITLGTGTFGETVGETATLSGLRMSADIVVDGGPSMGAMQARISGLTESMMNKLTTVGYVQASIKGKNTIALAAGDDVNGLQLAFSGTIYDAWADYSSQPDVAFNVIAYPGLLALIKPVDAVTYKGSVDAALIMAELAKTMGMTFENNGVSVQLSNPYFPGTALMQVRACAQAANIYFTVDRNVLAIWPKAGSRAGEIPLISPETGMVGYPALNSMGMSVETLYHPDIRPGGIVEVRSSLPMACGKFKVGPYRHSLSSEMPGGPWFTRFQCSHVS